VTPEAAGNFAKAHEYLTTARAWLDILHYTDEAGRAAYLAGYHAAQALIYDCTGREAKTHKGVHSQFNRLAKRDPRFCNGAFCAGGAEMTTNHPQSDRDQVR